MKIIDKLLTKPSVSYQHMKFSYSLTCQPREFQQRLKLNVTLVTDLR